MSQRILTPATFLGVLIALVVLTVLTVSISFIHVAEVWHIVIGLSIGTVKAGLVVLFFMHAIASPRVTWCIIAVACFWMGILVVLTLGDYFSRGMIPFMPGH